MESFSKYMEYENQTLEADPGEQLTDVSSAEGAQNDAGIQTAVAAQPALSLEEINALTRRNYSSVDDARKGIGSLASMVGKKEVVKEVVPTNLVDEVNALKAQVAEANFYTEHPELKPHKEVISALGPNPYDVIKDPVKQKVLNAVQASEAKETLTSNSRITQPTSADLEQDLESIKKTGDWVSFLKKHKGIDI